MPAILISAGALLVSIVTAWLTLFRRGSLGMTQPVLIGFLYDLPAGTPKVFFRAMLYATGRRGHIIEAVYLKVRRGDSVQMFNFWMYGETKALLIGSGLRVGEDGLASNHHFMPPKDTAALQFLAGEYTIEAFAKIVNRKSTLPLCTAVISLSQEQAVALHDQSNGVLFTWEPDSQRYHGQIFNDRRSPFEISRGAAAL